MKVLALAFLFIASIASAQDAFPLASAQIVNAPDVRGWSQTATITSLFFDGTATHIDFTKKDGPNRWPDVVPAGWDGPLEYTLWLFLQVNGQWVGSGFIQFWNGREASGGPGDPDVPSLYHVNWFYAARWAPLFGHGPIRPGESIGFMVTSGNARDSVGPYGPQERSNVVVIQATDRGAFSFNPLPPIVTPPPVIVTPPPVPTLPGCDLSQVYQQLATIHEEMATKGDAAIVNQNVTEGRTENKAFFARVAGEWKKVVAYVAPVIGAIFLGRGTK